MRVKWVGRGFALPESGQTIEFESPNLIILTKGSKARIWREMPSDVQEFIGDFAKEFGKLGGVWYEKEGVK